MSKLAYVNWETASLKFYESPLYFRDFYDFIKKIQGYPLDISNTKYVNYSTPSEVSHTRTEHLLFGMIFFIERISVITWYKIIRKKWYGIYLLLLQLSMISYIAVM
jgi:hypothetical protein